MKIDKIMIPNGYGIKSVTKAVNVAINRRQRISRTTSIFNVIYALSPHYHFGLIRYCIN